MEHRRLDLAKVEMKARLIVASPVTSRLATVHLHYSSEHIPLPPPSSSISHSFSSTFSLAVPAAAIESPAGAFLLSVLQEIVALAHTDPSTRWYFSWLAARDESLAGTPCASTFWRTLFNLKLKHIVYLRMLEWKVRVLQQMPSTALKRPVTASHGINSAFTSKQVWYLEPPFDHIELRVQDATARGGGAE